MYVVPDMNEAPFFSGDNDVELKSFQFSLHRSFIPYLARSVCREFFQARDTRPGRLEKLWDVVAGSCDHRPLLASYEHLCAKYRQAGTGVMPSKDTDDWGKEMNLLIHDWQTWWQGAVKAICTDIPLREACAECCIVYDAPRNAAKEEHPLELVRQRFPL